MQSEYSRSQPVESKLTWLRCHEEGLKRLGKRERQPKRLGRLTPECTAAGVVRARHRKVYGSVLPAWYLGKHGGAALSPNGVCGVLKRAGLIKKRHKPGRPPRAAPVRRARGLVQMDLKEPPRAAQGLRSVLTTHETQDFEQLMR